MPERCPAIDAREGWGAFQFDCEPYVLCAMGDGHLVTYCLNRKEAGLHSRKVLSLATKPITLRSFRSHDASHVFAASDRPTIIYSSNRKLLYSNLNENEVTLAAALLLFLDGIVQD